MNVGEKISTKSMHVSEHLNVGDSAKMNKLAVDEIDIGAWTKIKATDEGIQVERSGTRKLSLDTTGGVMHGVWSADFAMSTSDRRLKNDITDLDAQISADWVLRELRPVSF